MVLLLHLCAGSVKVRQMDDLRPLVITFSAANFVIGMGAFVVVGLIEPVAASFPSHPKAPDR